MKRDESWRQRRLSLARPPEPRPRSEADHEQTKQLLESALWHAPDDGTAPAPHWETETGREAELCPGEPVAPICTSTCPWYMDRHAVNMLASLIRGRRSAIFLPARCMHPVRQGAAAEDLHSWCWPAYIDIWQRSVAGKHQANR